jgi:polysaccharide export outer membrane protein
MDSSDTPTSALSSNSALIRGAWLPLLSLGVVLCGGVSCESTSSSSSAMLAATGPVRSNTLSAGDVVSIGFPATAELNQSQKIRLDGKISLPMVGEVTAAGKSPSGLQEELVVKYKEFLQDPKVIVSLINSAAVVYVNGEVLSPGKVVLDRPMTVYEVVMESGGFSQVANAKKVILTRQEGGKLARRELDMKSGTDSASIYVKPFDTITVSQSWF